MFNLRALLHKKRVEQELDEELRFHLEKQIERNVAQGMSAEAARYAALRKFGNVGVVKEECREAWGVRFLEELAQDLRYGLRQLRRNPGFTIVAVLTLALGIGANTAIFTVVNTVLLRPLPYRDPGRLVWAAERFPHVHGGAVVISPDFIAWKDSNQVFEQIGAFGGEGGANLTGAGEPARVNVINITAGLFPMLGVQPILGRTFTPDEDKQGQNHVALISERLWRTRFGAHREALGKTIHLDGNSYMVVGVMPSSLQYPAADVWTPIALNTPQFSAHSPNWSILRVIGRLTPGATPGQARSDLQLITEQMNTQYPPQAARFRAHVKVEVIPLHQILVRNVRSLLLVLLGAVGFVLLIACANVANLLLSRAAARGREMAVRAALGAARARLIRQLLTESLALAVTGGALGFFAGVWAVQLLKKLIPPNLPSEISLDIRVFGFVIGIALLAVILFGLVPALAASRANVSEALKAGGAHAGTGGGTHRLRNLLVVGEVSLSLVLLIGAGLLARSFVRLSRVNLGFDPNHLLLASVWRPVTPGLDAVSQAAFFHGVLKKVRELPGVMRVAATTHYPLSMFNELTGRLTIQGEGSIRVPQPISVASISPDYFRTMGIPLLKGRVFDDHDANSAPKVVIVDETLAREVFKGRDPVGRRISSGEPNGSWRTVVGVVADTRNYTLEEQPWPEIFTPYRQEPRYFMTFVIRTSGDPLALAGAVRKAVQSLDKDQPVSSVQSMTEMIASSTAPQWLRMMLLGLFALLALTLAAIGIFGVMAYSVNQRTHEIGIRMALGAERRDVLKMVVGQGLKLALIGVVIGIVGALVLTRFLSSLLYGVKPTDPLTFVAVSLLLIAVALVACYIPARRAAKVDPMVALRYE